ncbi:MFS transporter [Roseomonas marmotae]|uniref:MFS transporter n=1 Tax=Roseomonas marmotae TaxID=2768161 RepID=A0ABS3KBT5_9PROT|nr:MFS transporter [Roseomonas marmotae]MBO1073806.1 MFS transporter [Roseomonas marmotae]QTI78564.1 MFS transporter [Roseomonas marmotae]
MPQPAGEQTRATPGADGAKGGVPLWIIALGTTLGMQTVASFLSQSLPVIAPLLTAGAGLAPERIGNLSSLNSLGTVLFLLFGGPLLARLGPVRMLQIGALTAVAGLVVAASGWWPLLLLGALLMGVGYGPSPPAGSRILAASAPPGHRTLIFSIKQAGAPAGGALAGLLVAPVAAQWGWAAGLLVPVAVGLAATAIIAPARARLDTEREPGRDISLAALFNWRTVIQPYVMLKANPVLLTVTVLAFSFAIVQGSLFSFSVTYLVTERQMPLHLAGLVYAGMQLAGVFARIFLGWLADRTGRPTHNLTAQAFIAAGMVLAFSALPVQPPILLAVAVAVATGFFAASWNGIYLAEVARLSPPGRISEVTSSSTVVTFLGYISGPSIFSVLVTWTGGYQVPFLFIAGQLAVMAVIQVIVLLRRGRAGA